MSWVGSHNRIAKCFYALPAQNVALVFCFRDASRRGPQICLTADRSFGSYLDPFAPRTDCGAFELRVAAQWESDSQP